MSLTTCMHVWRIERKYRKGAMQRITSFNLCEGISHYFSSIASKLVICMDVNMNKYEITTETKKNAIINSALKLFGESGFTKVSIKNIAFLANVSPVSIYNYFGSKETLVEKCADVVLEDTINRANEILRSGADFKTKIIKALTLCTNEINSSISKYFSNEAIKDPALIHLLVESFNKKKELIFKDYIELGKKECVIEKSIPTSIILNFMNTLNFIGSHADQNEMDTQYIEQIHHLFLYGVIGKPYIPNA